jgi:type IV pilus assembly protein PilM
VDDQSIWKKEISFGRKRKEPKPEPEQTDSAAEAASEEPKSIWKKEISFGRKKKGAPAEPEVVADASGPVQRSDPETGPAQPPHDESMWKRAVSFSPSVEAEQPVVEEPVAEEEPVAAVPEVVADASEAVQESDVETGPAEAGPDESGWTKEVSFSRAAEPAEPVEEEPAAGEEPVAAGPEVVADASEAVQGSDLETGPAESSPDESGWTREVSFSRTVESAESVAEEPDASVAEVVADASDAVHGSDLETGPAGASPDESVWKKEVSFSRAEETEQPVAQEPAEVEPVAVADASEEPTVVAEVPAETWSATPSPPPVHALPAAAEPVAVPDLPVAIEPVAGEKSVPFWKKDISLGGKKSEKKPRAERAPKEKKAKKERQPRVRKERAPKVKAARGSKGAKRLVGLKVGASQLAAARVANNGSAELLQLAREPLEPGIVVGGELRDPDALAEALKEFFAKHKLPKKGVRLGIANNRIGVRTFDIAGIHDQKQLTNAIRFRAQEALPIPIDEAVLDFQVLSDGVDDQGQPTKRILLVVAYRELIDRYMDACKKAGIQLVGIDLEAFALLRALQAPQDGTGSDPSAALVAVSIGHDRSTFAVSDGRICEFTRVLEWGGAALNVAIARALDAAPSEVDAVKRALALTDEMVPDGLTPEQAKKARDAMRRAIQTFARELVSSLQYYQNQPGSLGIGEIVLTGGTAHLHGLAGELERLIGVRVRVGDPLARMKVSKKVGEAEQVGSLAVAIGLGIED